jgi:hypothetical protein
MRAWLGALAVVSCVIAGCHGSVAGRLCDRSACPANFECVVAGDGMYRCMQSCSLNETVCTDGSACLPVMGPTGTMSSVCYLGGMTAIGQPCTAIGDCTRTGVCIQSQTTGQTACFVGCNLDGSHMCPGGGACQPTIGNTEGFCASGGI